MATPLGSAGVRFSPQLTDPDNQAFSAHPRVLMNPVSPGWFATFGTRIVSGRDFTPQDRLGAPDVAIVNEAFARRYFVGASPVGRTIAEADTPTNRYAIEIVGVAQDAAFTSAREPIEPTLYRPLAQRLDSQLLTAVSSMSISVRARDAASPRLSASVGTAIGDVDRNLGFTFQTLTETLSPYYVRERLLALVSMFFGTLALLMAALGLYGVTAYSVSRRRTEIGIRMALGAEPAGIARLVLSRVTALVGLGIVAGVALSVWASRFVAALLYGIPPRDPRTFVSAVATLMVVGALAAAFPVWRASRLDPAAVLREG
jgi:putative ABC transport system permease protein